MIRRSLLTLPLLVALTGCTHLKMGLFLLNSDPSASDPTSITRGREAFVRQCASCHGAAADGNGPDASTLTVVPTNFRSPDYRKPVARIAARITYGKGSAMPAFEDIIPSGTVWDIAHYIHSLQGAE